MQDDDRCCGTGTCLIDAQGRCWCGQQWDGKTLCAPDTNADPAPKGIEKPLATTQDLGA